MKSEELVNVNIVLDRFKNSNNKYCKKIATNNGQKIEEIKPKYETTPMVGGFHE